MNIDAITLNECKNDGSYIHIYYQEHLAKWTAYGISAYILERMAADGKAARITDYSYRMMMPSVTLASSELQKLLSTGYSIKENPDSPITIRSNMSISMDNYLLWVTDLREARRI